MILDTEHMVLDTTSCPPYACPSEGGAHAGGDYKPTEKYLNPSSGIINP